MGLVKLLLGPIIGTGTRDISDTRTPLTAQKPGRCGSTSQQASAFPLVGERNSPKSLASNVQNVRYGLGMLLNPWGRGLGRLPGTTARSPSRGATDCKSNPHRLGAYPSCRPRLTTSLLPNPEGVKIVDLLGNMAVLSPRRMVLNLLPPLPHRQEQQVAAVRELGCLLPLLAFRPLHPTDQ